MSSERKPTKLDIHRTQFHFLNKKIPLVQLSSLSPEEEKLVADDMLGRIKVNSIEKKLSADDYYDLYAHALADWGVMCPHPHDRRLYDGEKSFVESSSHRWFICQMCKCAVINSFWKPDEKKKE